MNDSRAGTPAQPSDLVDVAHLVTAYYTGVPDPSDPDHELYASGALLPGPEARLAGPTFAEWLASTPAAAAPVT